ncbi:sporulation integral membrane protein YtvI [Tepidimonas alkaliphilus]|uniref:Sporulation integral membrane protein YtvI n=1 Tax=Tepidimonas alkaliphilus TaxID=2588942 RepID=A0A554W569_9BURK|nr:AI-2E family transporter [Tepidimonas alkaliphilus]TSE18726.1 sporulation integral membrane protein YtvI [Tepidimonas alkaliphilus]
MPISPAFRQALLWLAVALAVWWAVSLLAPVLFPLLLALGLAYVLQPLVAQLARWRVPRWLGAGVAIAGVMLLALALVLIIVPVLAQQWPLLREQIPALLERFNAWLVPHARRLGLDVAVDVEGVRQLLRNLISGHEEQLLAHLLSSLRIGGSVLITVLGNAVLMPVVAYYLLLDWNAMGARVQALIPPAWRGALLSWWRDTDELLGQYLRGQMLVMGLLAVYYAVALWAVGLDLALPIGVFTGLAVFVPYVGFGVGLVLALLAALLQFQDWWGVLAVAAVYGVGQVVESFWLTPRLVGERIGLHPVAVIFALMAFGHLFGFVGVLLALPASAVALVALRRLQALYLRSALFAAPPAAGPVARKE